MRAVHMLVLACSLMVGMDVGPSVAADAAPCPLQEIESLPLVELGNGSFNVPVKLDGQPNTMEIDTGSMGTEITAATAKSLGLDITPVGDSRVFLGSVKMDMSTTLKSFGLGHIAVNDWPVWIIPETLLNEGTIGLIGADTLMGFDVEFDPVHSKVNLFVPNTCTKNAAYWAHGAAVAVPIEIDRSTHIMFDAMLDGKPITVMLDTGAFNSFMSIDVAEDMFGFRSNDARLKPASSKGINGAAAAIYEFPFKSLSLEGLTISNPDIQLLPRDLFPYGFRDQMKVVLGMNVLRRLRTYVAYKQHVIYLTEATAQ